LQFAVAISVMLLLARERRIKEGIEWAESTVPKIYGPQKLVSQIVYI